VGPWVLAATFRASTSWPSSFFSKLSMITGYVKGFVWTDNRWWGFDGSEPSDRSQRVVVPNGTVWWTGMAVNRGCGV
jgi:hypothetical protein